MESEQLLIIPCKILVFCLSIAYSTGQTDPLTKCDQKLQIYLG